MIGRSILSVISEASSLLHKASKFAGMSSPLSERRNFNFFFSLTLYHGVEQHVSCSTLAWNSLKDSSTWSFVFKKYIHSFRETSRSRNIFCLIVIPSHKHQSASNYANLISSKNLTPHLQRWWLKSFYRPSACFFFLYALAIASKNSFLSDLSGHSDSTCSCLCLSVCLNCFLDVWLFNSYILSLSILFEQSIYN